MRVEEKRCPFCRGEAPTEGVPILRTPHPRLSRAAQFAFCVVLGGGVSRCGSQLDSAPIKPPPVHSTASVDASAAPDAASDAAAEAPHRPNTVAIYGSSELRILQFVAFDLEGMKLDSQYEPTLDAIAEILQHHPFVLEVQGHSAESEKGWKLSLRRAQLVKKALVKRGVAPDRLIVKDYGKTKPMSEDDKPERYAVVRFEVLRDDYGLDGGRDAAP